jgi:hypothetical protein
LVEEFVGCVIFHLSAVLSVYDLGPMELLCHSSVNSKIAGSCDTLPKFYLSWKIIEVFSFGKKSDLILSGLSTELM